MTAVSRMPALPLLLLALALAAPSRAADRILFETRSAYAHIVVTEEDNGDRILRFGHRGARQSLVRPGDPDHLALSYARVALAGLALAPEPSRLLVLGLGGGSLPMVLRKYHPAAAIDVVEIDPEVAKVARSYFGFREDGLMRVHIDDGRRFVEARDGLYDVIMLDAFGTDNVPPHLATEQFLRAVRRILRPHGVVVANIWNRSANRLYDDMIRTYREVFEDLYLLQVEESANIILLALPRAREMSRQEFRSLCMVLAQRKAFRFAFGNDGRHGFERAGADDMAGSVLRDPPPGAVQK